MAEPEEPNARGNVYEIWNLIAAIGLKQELPGGKSSIGEE